MSVYTPLTVLLEIAESNRLAADDFSRKLSAAGVRAAKAAEKPVSLADGGGLVLYVPSTGAKVWRYRFRLAERPQTLTIGAFPAVSLEHARVAHRAARWLVARGIHPLQHVEAEIARQQADEKARSEHGFRQLAEKWMTATELELAPATVKNRRAMLEKHLFPKLGDRPIGEITRKELHALLTALDKETPVTAVQCRGYLNNIFEWAEDAEIVQGNPTPRVKILERAKKRRVVPRKKLELNRLGEFLKTLEDAPETAPATKVALRLVVLTLCRTSEVTAARWSEFDLDAALWVIPAERMKAKEVHTVRLSRQVVELLTEWRKSSAGSFVFPNERHSGKPMGRMTLSEWRRRWGFAEEMDIHGLRATGSTWANESGRYRPDVIEVALAHKEGDRVRAAYNRAEFIEDVSRLWQDWADLCDEKLTIARAENVVPFRQSA